MQFFDHWILKPLTLNITMMEIDSDENAVSAQDSEPSTITTSASYPQASELSDDFFILQYPNPAGTCLLRSSTTFERFASEQESKGSPPWSPFASHDEWELAKWLLILKSEP